MKKTYIAILTIISLVAIIAAQNMHSINSKRAFKPQSTVAPIFQLERQSNNEGPVTVEVVPRFSTEIAFEIVLDTHSEELNEDLTTAATLVDDTGKKYEPVGWNGNPPGGHHREGLLLFNPITPAPKFIKLILTNVGGTRERSFIWDLK